MKVCLLWLGLITAGLSVSWADDTAPTKLQGTKPNIVLIITDDQGYGPIARHGHPWLHTPNQDALFDRSVRFERFMASPTCAPTRSALMTGRHPMRNGITHTILERERLTLDATTLPQTLKTAGYTSAIFGKWHLGDEDAYQPNARGFDESFIHGAGGIGQSYECSCADAPDNQYFDPYIRHNGKFVKTKGFCTDVFFNAAIRWIDKQKASQQPFFAYLATNAPHAPYYAPEANIKRFKALGFNDTHAGFYGMVENIDENLGRLMAALESMDLMQETLIIFMSDNGMAGTRTKLDQPIGHAADQSDLFIYNAGMKGLKGSVDEGGVRVPFFVRWDGHIAPGRNVPHVVAHIDVFPTLAALAGADLPAGQVEGRSLLPLLSKADATWDERYLFDHTGRWPTGANPDDFKWKNFTVRSSQFRLVDGDKLFDMHADPGQTKNCIDQHAALADDMKQAYDKWWQATRPMMVNESAPMSPTRPYHEAFYKQQKAGGIPEWEGNP
ncbi:MAG: arylsulfatase [Planctomycetaceae bacterium]